MAYLRSGRLSALHRGVRFLPGGQSNTAAPRFSLSSTPTFSPLHLPELPRQSGKTNDASSTDQMQSSAEASA
jgi:hypothetical protein